MKTMLHQIVRRALSIGAALLFVSTASAIVKPTGTFASSGAAGPGIYANPNLRGVLIRTGWADLEPTPGNFIFTAIASQIATVQANGLPWSLAISGGGTGSPAWLTDPVASGGLGAPFITYSFRGVPGYKLPLFWDPLVQDRLLQLAIALAAEFNDDASLQLVYIPQMTANGIEGHLQGVNMNVLIQAGSDRDGDGDKDATDFRINWIEAAETATRNFAYAFDKKALAFEVHEVNGTASIPETIINDLWNDPTLGQRVGAAMWWISGKTTYQPDLITVLTNFPGDIYGQVIGRSDQTERFQDGDYTSVFWQAREIGLRYIEPWEYEFKYVPNSANGAWDETFADFNAWADLTFDVTPPVFISLQASPDVLRIPNHKMVAVTLTATVEDDVDPEPHTRIVAVTSNEHIDGLGDGATSSDWEITGALTLLLRAERSGGGTGRIYAITVASTDLAGNTGTRVVQVTVPHDKR